MTNALLCLISRFTDCTGSVGAPRAGSREMAPDRPVGD